MDVHNQLVFAGLLAHLVIEEYSCETKNNPADQETNRQSSFISVINAKKRQENTGDERCQVDDVVRVRRHKKLLVIQTMTGSFIMGVLVCIGFNRRFL